MQLHAMSERISAGKEAKTGLDVNDSQNTRAYTNSPTVTPRPPFSSIHLPPEVKLPKDRQVDSLSSSPIVFSNTLKSLDGRGLFQENGRSEDESSVPRTDSRQNGTKGSRLEWLEQYEPGVYITFTTLPGGQRGLKRVRFR